MTDKVLRLRETTLTVGLSRSTIYAKLADPDDDFPRPITLGKRAVGWRESDLQNWLSSRQVA